MRIAITGATGLVGRSLSAALSADGHEIVAVSRSPAAASRLRDVAPVAGVVVWDPVRGEIDAGGLEGCDAVIHLAGESIAGLWTRRKRRRIRESRVRGTTLLAETLARLARPPAVLLSASAVGYYGNRPPDSPVDEDDPPGTGFLAEVVVAWEAATRPAEAAGIRTVRMRFGVVLAPDGGMLAAVLPAFRLGLGAVLGSGAQVMSWIALADIPPIVRFLLEHPSLTGPVNAVSPNPVTNAEFTRTLGRVLHRPTFLRAPAAVLRALPGAMAEEMLLGGARVVPGRLAAAGCRFAFPDLEGALRAMLRRPGRDRAGPP